MQAAADGRAERRGGAAAPPETGPLRRCIASRRVAPRTELLRFVVGPQGELVFDPAGKLPGRGLWLSARRDMLEKACARNLFAKSARAAVRVPDNLASHVETTLRSRCLALIGLARRAGQAEAGFEKVRSRLGRGEGAVLVQAHDAGADGRRRLARLGLAARPGLKVIELFDAAELGPIFGRPAAVHVVVLPGGLAERLVIESDRLAGMMKPSGGSAEQAP